jgi:hypothetical protein
MDNDHNIIVHNDHLIMMIFLIETNKVDRNSGSDDLRTIGIRDHDIGVTKSSLLRRLSMSLLSLVSIDKDSRSPPIHDVDPWIITTNLQEQHHSSSSSSPSLPSSSSAAAAAPSSHVPPSPLHEEGAKSQGQPFAEIGFVMGNPSSLARKRPTIKLRFVILVHCLIAWDRLARRMKRRQGDGTLVTIRDEVR